MSNILKHKWFIMSLGIVLGVIAFTGVKSLSNVEGKNFNIWNGTVNIEYFEAESKDFEKKSSIILETYEIYKSNQRLINVLTDYESFREQVMASEPKTEVLTVERVASSWAETPAHMKTDILSGKVSVDGTGKKTENYSVVAFNDGTFIKVTTGQMSAVRVGEKVIRKTALELLRNQGVYFVEERVTYQPLYKK